MGSAIRVTFASLALLVAVSGARAVTQYNGTLNSPAVDLAFAVATGSHSKQFINFDEFVLGPHQYTPLDPYQYIQQGVVTANLDVRNVNGEPWTHSQPNGAWHTGFSSPITTPYSFIFTQPVASFGMFSNDVEAQINVTVLGGGTQSFIIPFQGGADVTQFHGFVATSNQISRIDFLSGDYHIIDDVQFGIIPEPATAGMLLLPAAFVALTRRKARVDSDVR